MTTKKVKPELNKRIKGFMEHLKKFIEEDPSLKWICQFQVNKSPSTGFEVKFFNKKKTNFKMLGKKKNDLLFTLFLEYKKKEIYIGNIVFKYVPQDNSKKPLFIYKSGEDVSWCEYFKINELEEALEHFEYLFLFKLDKQPKDHYFTSKNKSEYLGNEV